MLVSVVAAVNGDVIALAGTIFGVARTLRLLKTWSSLALLRYVTVAPLEFSTALGFSVCKYQVPGY